MRVLALLLCLASPAAAAPADIVLLGEVHDNPDAHLGQADRITALGPTAVVFEMLTEPNAATIMADPAALPAIWADGGWPDLALYQPVFDALGSAVILGAAAPRTTVQSVYSDGAAALFGPQSGRFGLDLPLDPADQTAREDLQFHAHCQAMPRDLMAGMVEVQRYRDAQIARTALDALATYGPPVAVVLGNGHARTDWGVPAMIARAAPQVTTYTVGFVEAETDDPYDEVVIVPPALRDDPCAELTGG